jgi:hypothetical protein
VRASELPPSGVPVNVALTRAPRDGRPRITRFTAATLFAVLTLLILPGVATADTGQIRDVSFPSPHLMRATFTVTHSSDPPCDFRCDPSWNGVAVIAAAPCLAFAPTTMVWKSATRVGRGTVTETVTVLVPSGRVHLCLFVQGGFGTTLVAERVVRAPKCGDGIDNDADGAIDDADRGCASTTDDNEKLTRTPSLSRSDALHYLRTALGAGFGSAWRRAGARRVSCRRGSRTRYACRLSWTHARRRYSGRASIALSRKGEFASWAYALRVRRRVRGGGVLVVYRFASAGLPLRAEKH